ncbi:MAG: hypothetical protein K1X88_00270 [Nannocystaceae bacterium]|nr:hypothetical protein [Nannocystaceae bacterium]
MVAPLLALLLAAAHAAPSELDAPGATARIESITPALDGRGGTLVLRPIALDGTRTELAFGGKRCRDHRLDAVVVAQLFEALRTRQGVTATAEPSVDGGPACLRAITFFALDP